ncbi:MFS transporter, partial [Streptomyces sp. NPDC057638]|uniref:MFS transporter n=1 Tax=Streptomyces sp. NPDC057638 TaxID=3346190 RepID=UPI00367E78EB
MSGPGGTTGDPGGTVRRDQDGGAGPGGGAVRGGGPGRGGPAPGGSPARGGDPAPGGGLLHRFTGRFAGPQLFLLGASFLITVGSFAVLPYMSVLLHERWGLGLGAVGLVLAVASLVQFSGGVAGAALARRIGLRATMLVALGVRTAGFACFVPGVDRPVLAVVALFLVSTGAALYLPANKAYLVAGSAPERRPGLLAASGSAFNAGIALGPPAGAPLVLGSPGVLFGAVAVLFALIGLGHVLLPRVADDRPDATGAGTGKGRTARGASPFAYTLLAVYVFMFFQHYAALYAVPRTSTAYFAVVLAGYALLLVVAQPLLAGWIAGLAYGRALRLGFGSMALGMVALAAGGRPGIALGAVALCLAETVLFLRNDLEALERSRAPAATVFGHQRLAAGLGAFSAALLGGPLYGAAEDGPGVAGFWLLVAAQAVVLPVLLWGGARWRGRRAGRPPPDPEPKPAARKEAT